MLIIQANSVGTLVYACCSECGREVGTTRLRAVLIEQPYLERGHRELEFYCPDCRPPGAGGALTLSQLLRALLSDRGRVSPPIEGPVLRELDERRQARAEEVRGLRDHAPTVPRGGIDWNSLGSVT